MAALAINDIYVSLFLAMALGMVVGIERFVAHKTAGMRTYTLVSMGAALFIVISRLVTVQLGSVLPYDYHVAAQIIAAAGFLGVGAIFHTQQGVSGITTASGLWVAAGIGMACGFGFYRIAVLATVLTLFIFIVLWFIERQVRRLPFQRNESDHSL